MTTPRGLFSYRCKSLVVLVLFVALALMLSATATEAQHLLISPATPPLELSRHDIKMGGLSLSAKFDNDQDFEAGAELFWDCPSDFSNCVILTVGGKSALAGRFVFTENTAGPVIIQVYWASSIAAPTWQQGTELQVALMYTSTSTLHSNLTPLFKVATCWDNTGRDTCYNNGSCPESGTIDACSCAEGFSGPMCQHKYDWRCDYANGRRSCDYWTPSQWASANSGAYQCDTPTVWVSPVGCFDVGLVDIPSSSTPPVSPSLCLEPLPEITPGEVIFQCKGVCASDTASCEVTVDGVKVSTTYPDPCGLVLCPVAPVCGQTITIHMNEQDAGVARLYADGVEVDSVNFGLSQKEITFPKPYTYTGTLTYTIGNSNTKNPLTPAFECKADNYCDVKDGLKTKKVLCGSFAFDNPAWYYSTEPTCQDRSQSITVAPSNPECRVGFPDGSTAQTSGCVQIMPQDLTFGQCQSTCAACGSPITCSSLVPGFLSPFTYKNCDHSCDCWFNINSGDAAPGCGIDYTIDWIFYPPNNGPNNGFIQVTNDSHQLIGVIPVPDLGAQKIKFKWMFPTLPSEDSVVIFLFPGTPLEPGPLIAISSLQVDTTNYCTVEMQCKISPNGPSVKCVGPELSQIVAHYFPSPPQTSFTILPTSIPCSDATTTVTASIKAECALVNPRGAFVGLVDSTYIPSPCPVDFQQEYTVPPCEKTCQRCNAPTCLNRFEGNSLRIPAICPSDFDCSCTPSYLSFRDSDPISCLDTPAVIWKYESGLPEKEEVIEVFYYDYTSNSPSAVILATHTVSLTTQITLLPITFTTPENTPILLRFQNYPTPVPPALWFSAGSHCTNTLHCYPTSTDNPSFSFDSIQACGSPDPEDALEQVFDLWSPSEPFDPLSFTCSSKVTFNPPLHQYCAVGPADSNRKIATEMGNCKNLALEPVDYAVTCLPECSYSQCDVSCTASFEDANLPNFSACGDIGNALDCGCEATWLALPSTPLDCETTHFISWNLKNLDGRDPSDVLIISHTETDADGIQKTIEDQRIPVELKIGSVVFPYEGIVPSGVELTFSFEHTTALTTDNTPAVLLSGQPCLPAWKCLDQEGKRQACDNLLMEMCTSCGTLTIPSDRMECYTGSEKTPGACAPMKPEENTLDCICRLDCVPLSGPTVDCNDPRAWIPSTQCGLPDYRQGPRLTTLSGTHILCSADEITDPDHRCYLKTTRLTKNHIESCSVSPQCRGDATMWTECDPSFNNCTPDVKETCAPRTRLVSCAVQHGVEGAETSNFDQITDSEIAQIFGISASDPDLKQTEVAQAIADLRDDCQSVKNANPVNNDCKCTPSIYCWADPANQLFPTVSDLSNLVACEDEQVNFPCPDRCRDAGLDPLNVSRFVFCRGEDGKFVTMGEGSECGDQTVPLHTFSCEAKAECEATFVCKQLDPSVATIASEQDLVLVDTANADVCGDDFSVQCFSEQSASATSPHFPIQADTCTARNQFEHYSARQVGCNIREKGSLKPISPNPAYSIFCDNEFTRPKALKSGCRDWNGCDPPEIRDIAAFFDDDSLGDEPIVEVDLNLSLSRTFLIDFNMDFLGPLHQSEIVVQYATKIGSATAQTSKLWLSAQSQLAVSTSPSLTWSFTPETSPFDFKSVGANGEVIFKDSQTVFIRVFVKNTYGYHYPLTLNVLRRKTCDANPGIFTGLNVDCEDKNGVATLVCANGITPDLESPYGPCSRSTTCNALTPTCQNSGFYLVSDSASGCADSCSCPGGQTYVDQCKTCAQCPIGLGVPRAAQDTECGCASCRTGFKNGSGIGDVNCSDCDVFINIRITDASPNLVSSLPSNSDPQHQSEVDFFISHTRQLIARQLNYPVAQITIPTDSIIVEQGTDVTFKVVLTGNCLNLISQKDFFTLVSSSNSSPNLSDAVNGYDKDSFDDVLVADKSFAAFALNNNSTVVSESVFDPPPVFSPSTKGKKKSTNVVAIVVPIVVGVVVICAVVVIVYLLCFGKDSAGSDGSNKETKKTERKASAKPSAAPQETNQAHLELV